MKIVTDAVSGDSFQGEIDNMLSTAPVQCSTLATGVSTAQAANPDKSYLVPELDDFFRNFAIFLGVMFIIVISVLVLVRRVKKQRYNAKKEKASVVRSLEAKEKITKIREEKLNTETTSMFTSSSVPIFARFFIPIGILCNIALFLSGHLSLGAKVDAQFTLVGTSLDIDEIFTFTMLGTSEYIQIWVQHFQVFKFHKMQPPV